MKEIWNLYRDSVGRDYVQPDRTGSLVLEVLPFLIGQKWDGFALGYVHSLRPSRVRVIWPGEMKAGNAVPWRVTVYVDGSNLVRGVEQECEVGLPEGVKNGYELDQQMEWLIRAKLPTFKETKDL